MGQEDYQDLASFLNKLIRRLKLLEGAEGLCLTAIALLVAFSLGLAVEELKSYFPYAPVVYALATFALLGLGLAGTLVRVCKRVSRERAALYVESQRPALRNNLINSLQLYPQIAGPAVTPGVSAPMVLALLRTTRRQIQNIHINELVRADRVRHHLKLLGVLFVPVLAIVLFHPASVGKTFSLLLNPLKDLPATRISLDVTPKGARVARGSSVTIVASASGEIPKAVELVLRPVPASPEAAQAELAPERLPMDGAADGKFSRTIPGADKNLQYRVVAGPFSSPWYNLEVVDPPEIGNLRATLYPPHYTGLPRATVEGGNLDGIKGSTVNWEAAVTKDIVKAALVFEDGRQLPLKIDGRKIQGSFVLLQSQRYQVAIEDALGFRNAAIAYELKARPDGFPTVDLLSPTEDLEVNGDETLQLEFSARDDFGIEEINLVSKIGPDRQEKISLFREGRKKSLARERFGWDLGKLALQEKEEVVYHLEVIDNDTISGPKVGSSRALRLRLKDLKGEHRALAEMVQELSRQMLDLLADHLEAPGPAADPRQSGPVEQPPFDQKAGDLLKRIDEIMQRTEKDRLSDFATWSDLEALKRNLQYTKDELWKKQHQAAAPEELGRARDEISTELERMAQLSEEISKRLEAQRLAQTGQDLLKSQERLMDSLDKLKSGDAKLDSVLKEISELAKLLGSLQQAMSQFASRLADDFMNAEALQSLSFGDMFSLLDQIRQKLMKGDIEGAMQLARELFNQLASMVASLQSAQQGAMASSLDRMQGEMMRSANELQQIIREQQEILVDTEGVEKDALGQKDELLKERVEEYHDRAYERLARLTEIFPDEERESASAGPAGQQLDDATMNNLLKNMIERLLKKDFAGLREVMERARQELAKKRAPQQEPKARQAEADLQELERGLARLLAQPEGGLSDADKTKLRELARREGNVQQLTEELHEKLSQLFQLFPSLDPKIARGIQEAAKSMRQAEGRLGALDAPGAVPPEREALDRLSQAQEQMQNAMQQLAQRGQLGRMPVTFLFRRGRFLPSGRLVPLPGMPEFPQFDVAGGTTGLDMERFRLPGKEDYKVPRNFREEILESLKQGVPPQYKEQVERYFKHLSE
ncbi:MAG TPA: DUF4175 family protein [Candidatus Acidoferrales bacterium]|nr:DUF4175 family protein [Candidatus Acidoferrales bacterium]